MKQANKKENIFYFLFLNKLEIKEILKTLELQPKTKQIISNICFLKTLYNSIPNKL